LVIWAAAVASAITADILAEGCVKKQFRFKGT
jgi:hypothetical protein